MSGLYVVTGHSRGLGEALARRLLESGHTVLGLARHPALSLPDAPHRLTQWSVDLGDPAPAAERLQAWLADQKPGSFDSANLINNAGRLSRMGPIDATTAADLAAALRVGLEAPMLLTAAFLRATAGWAIPRRVLNVSSGLGRRAMAGSASYCAAKAGLDHFTRCTAMDEAARPNGARIVSLAPGVIDTDMQGELRGSEGSGFPDRDTFMRLKSEGQLVSAGETAQRLMAYLHHDDFGRSPVADVRDA